MYGYVRPYKPELTIREWETYGAVYCALCNELKTQFRFPARFLVNYDFTFLTMLLTEPRAKLDYAYKRCPAGFAKKQLCRTGRAHNVAAALSVIMGYFKLKDSVADNGALKSLFLYRPALAMIRPKYKSAASAHSEFVSAVQKQLDELALLEHNKSGSDDCARAFALALSAAGVYAEDDYYRRVLSTLLYQVGYVIYLLDAFDDLDDDLKHGRFNPLTELADTAPLRATLDRLARDAAASFELYRPNAFRSILENIFYLGIDNAIETTLNKRKDAPTVASAQQGDER